MASILIIDDDETIGERVSAYAHAHHHDVQTVSNASETLCALARRDFGVILADIRMPGVGGLALLREMLRRRPKAVVVLMTAHAAVADAVEAVRAGAYDYVIKPSSHQQMEALLGRTMEVQAIRREHRAPPYGPEPPLLESANRKMVQAITTARQVAASAAPVLLTGESGVGKSVLAAAIHNWSPRRGRPFVTVSCPASDDHRLASELFGHFKGTFAGALQDESGRVEAADGGTLFFNDVGELPVGLQTKLLRFLEEHRFERVGGGDTIELDARIVAATHRDLELEVAAGRFRQDLFFRLNVVGIRLPPLRERNEDLCALIAHTLTQLCTRYRRRPIQLAAEAQQALASYSWPGNLREVANVLERAVVLARGDLIRVEDLPDRLVVPPATPAAPIPHTQLSLEAIERRHIEQVLADSSTLEEAAVRLGINPSTLWRKRRRYGIDRRA